MNSIPNVCIENILSFIDAETLPSAISVCKDVHEIASIDTNDRWKKGIKQIPMYGERIPLIKCKSKMVTVLSMRDLVENTKCFVCFKSAYLLHDVYNVLLCKECVKSDFFKMVPFKKICRDLFVKSSSIESSDIKIVGLYCRRRVLEKDILRFSIEKHTKEGLDSMTKKRNDNKRKRMENKMLAVEERIAHFNYLYKLKYKQYKQYSKYDPLFENLDNVFRLMSDFKCYNFYGDLFDEKLNTFSTPEKGSNFTIAFVDLLSTMRYVGIMDDSYGIIYPYVGMVSVHHLMLRYIRCGINIEDTVFEIYDSNLNFKKRICRMDEYIQKNSKFIYPGIRKQLAIISCVEDDIDFYQDEFEQFISEGIGNPVSIAREKRISIFLNKYGYMNRYTVLHNNGFNEEFCRIQARLYAINCAHGMQIMNNVCIVDLPGILH